jgi:chromosome segregation ATPase
VFILCTLTILDILFTEDMNASLAELNINTAGKKVKTFKKPKKAKRVLKLKALKKEEDTTNEVAAAKKKVVTAEKKVETAEDDVAAAKKKVETAEDDKKEAAEENLLKVEKNLAKAERNLAEARRDWAKAEMELAEANMKLAEVAKDPKADMGDLRTKATLAKTAYKTAEDLYTQLVNPSAAAPAAPAAGTLIDNGHV